MSKGGNGGNKKKVNIFSKLKVAVEESKKGGDKKKPKAGKKGDEGGEEKSVLTNSEYDNVKKLTKIEKLNRAKTPQERMQRAIDKLTETARETAMNEYSKIATADGKIIDVPNRELVKIPGKAPKSCTHPNWKAYVAKKVGGFSSTSVLKNFNTNVGTASEKILNKSPKKVAVASKTVRVDKESALGKRKEELQIESRGNSKYAQKGEIVCPQPLYDEFNPRKKMTDWIARWNLAAPEEEIITPEESEDVAPEEEVEPEEEEEKGKIFDFKNPSQFTADDEGTMMQWDLNLNLINVFPGAGEGCIWTMTIDYSKILILIKSSKEILYYWG